VLVDGFDFHLPICGEQRSAAQNFGALPQMLFQDSDQTVYYYDYCRELAPGGGNASIDAVGVNFGQWLAGFGGRQVDVVAYSMGGLIVRSYLSGLNLAAGTISGRLSPGIRKLVFIATPHFGVTGLTAGLSALGLGGVQASQMSPGSALIWLVNTWNQWGDDLRGIDAVAIAGNGDAGAASDGVVGVSSASVGFAFPDGDGRTRVIPYCHIGGALAGVTSCSGGAIAAATGPAHPTYQIVRSFLDGTDAWRAIGLSPSQTTGAGGILWNAVSNTAQELPATASANVTLARSQLTRGDFAWYIANFPQSIATLGFTYAGQNWTMSGVSVIPGQYHVVTSQLGPGIGFRGLAPAAGLPPGALAVAPESLVSIYGRGFASSTASASYPWPNIFGDTAAVVDAKSYCPISYASPGQVNVLMPALAAGSHTLRVGGASGVTIITFMVEPAVPALFALAGNNAAALHANYQVISTSNPVAIGETISLYATGLGATTAANSLQVANITPEVSIDGQSAPVAFAGRAPGFQGLDQINVQVPAGVRRGVSVPVVVASGGRTSNQVVLAVN
jgi:uncharacterized protein (TIGR03437 family)